jgi:hypothetical protein
LNPGLFRRDNTVPAPLRAGLILRASITKYNCFQISGDSIDCRRSRRLFRHRGADRSHAAIAISAIFNI